MSNSRLSKQGQVVSM